MRIAIWNIKKCVFKVRFMWTNSVTSDCLLMYWIMFKFSHFTTRKLDNYLLQFKQRNRQTERVIIFWENSGDPLIDLKKIQVFAVWIIYFRCCTNLPIYVYPIQQSLSSICSSQPTEHERISCHGISCEVCGWVADWWLYSSRTYNWAYCEVVKLSNHWTAVHVSETYVC